MEKAFEYSRRLGMGASLRIVLMLAIVFFALDVSAQTTINGVVVDDTGETIIGASVLVKGTTNGTVTDFDGNFQLKCNEGSTLVISYIGFDPQEVPAKDGMTVTLSEDVAQLNEVVVVGYGSMAKKEISSSVVQISKENFNQGAASDPMALIAGKVTGLNVAATAEANPNATTEIQVRGAGSLTASNPGRRVDHRTEGCRFGSHLRYPWCQRRHPRNDQEGFGHSRRHQRDLRQLCCPQHCQAEAGHPHYRGVPSFSPWPGLRWRHRLVGRDHPCSKLQPQPVSFD